MSLSKATKKGVPTHNKTSPIDAKQMCQNPLFVFWGAPPTRLRRLGSTFPVRRASEDLLRQEGLQPGGHRLHGAQLLEGLLLLKGRASAPTAGPVDDARVSAGSLPPPRKSGSGGGTGPR